MHYKGISTSTGYAIAKVYKLVTNSKRISTKKVSNIEDEISKFQSALACAKKDLLFLREKAEKEIDDYHASIFDAHIQILEDPEIKQMTFDKLRKNHLSIEKNYYDITEQFIQMFHSLEDTYMQERIADFIDVRKRVLSYLQQTDYQDMSLMDENIILVGENILPGDIISVPHSYLKGFVSVQGGKTSHATILAKSLEIPSVINVSLTLDEIKKDETIIVDGYLGEIILSPSNKEVDLYLEKIKTDQRIKKMLLSKKKLPFINLNQRNIEFMANISSVADLQHALDYGAQGIGLFRTEFLYIGHRLLPTEKQQYQVYKKVLESFPNDKVIIRTLDIGGDKDIEVFKHFSDVSSFLKYRGLSFSVREVKILRIQLKALLKASLYGNLGILFPMVTSIDDLLQAKKIVQEVKEELVSDSIPIGNYKIGMMVETPEVASNIESFMDEIDFISIGTNDLLEFTYHISRTENKVNLYELAFQSPFSEFIKKVINVSKNKNKSVSVCGELASDPIASIYLLALGLDIFSMNAQSIQLIKEQFSKITPQDVQLLSEKLQKEIAPQDVIKAIKTINSKKTN